MREIKFRGKRIDNNEWVYGYLQKQAVEWEEYYITWPCTELINNCRVVIPKTIGQFTGLYDKNGVEIYEGDIVKSLINTFSIIYKKGCFFAVGINKSQVYTLFEEFEMCNKASVNLKVIGNIYDNEAEEWN